MFNQHGRRDIEHVRVLRRLGLTSVLGEFSGMGEREVDRELILGWQLGFHFKPEFLWPI